MYGHACREAGKFSYKVVENTLERKWKWSGATVSVQAFIIKFQWNPFRSSHTHTNTHSFIIRWILWKSFHSSHAIKFAGNTFKSSTTEFLKFYISFCKPQSNKLSNCYPITFSNKFSFLVKLWNLFFSAGMFIAVVQSLAEIWQRKGTS